MFEKQTLKIYTESDFPAKVNILKSRPLLFKTVDQHTFMYIEMIKYLHLIEKNYFQIHVGDCIVMTYVYLKS